MKILFFLLVQTFLIANIAQADFSRDVPDKMPVSHFQNRKFRKPTIEPGSNYRKPTIRFEGNYRKSLKRSVETKSKLRSEDVPKVRTKRICPEPKVIKSQEAKAIQVTAPPKPEYDSWQSSTFKWGVKAARWAWGSVRKNRLAKEVGKGVATKVVGDRLD